MLGFSDDQLPEISNSRMNTAMQSPVQRAGQLDTEPSGEGRIDSVLSGEGQPAQPDKPAAVALLPTRRLEYIDGLRALAALWVLFHHTIETSEPSVAMKLPVIGPLLASLFFGQFPVMVFLMLSGFCLFYPCVKKDVTQPQLNMSFGAYMFRRAKRIMPPYLAAGLFCIGMSFIAALQVGRWTIVTPIDTGVVVSHLLMVHNIIPSHANKIDYPMWSIGLEWQLYLLFPLLIWAFRRSNGPAVIAVTLLVAVIIRGTYRMLSEQPAALLHDGPFSYLEIFAVGMLAASLTVQGRRLLPAWALACVAFGGLALVRFGSGSGLVHDLATSAAAFSVLLLAIDARGRVSRFLSTPVLVRIGIFSYSLYLMHAPLVHLFWFALQPLQLSPDVTFLVLLLCVPLIVGLAYAFHCLFERPFMSTRLRPAAQA
jgi:peptidoglycan/LPS O-acetylase OafA/YrhL